MPMPKLLHPEDVRARCKRQFAREHLAWLGAPAGSGEKQTIALGAPTQTEAAANPDAVRGWAAAWSAWESSDQPGAVIWETREWPRLGTQRLPASLIIGSLDNVAKLAEQGSRWQRAAARHQLLGTVCVWLPGRPAPQRLFDALADYGDVDFERLLSLMRWLSEHPVSGLQLRQLPIVGLDTKWVEQRRGLIIDLLQCRPLQPSGDQASRDLHALLGLTRQPTRMRLRLLGDDLRRQVGGLCDIEAPAEELAALPIGTRLAFIVENLESGLALPAIPGAVALMKLGHAVNLLRMLPWLRAARVVVWGDIDTHGFAILDRVRAVLPQAESMLMDRHTLLSHWALLVEEPRPYDGPHLGRLSESERLVFDGLASNLWGVNVRLEQERLPWPLVLSALAESTSVAVSGDPGS
jgi:hypothetical protein